MLLQTKRQQMSTDTSHINLLKEHGKEISSGLKINLAELQFIRAMCHRC